MKKVLIITNNINPNSGWGRYSSFVINELIKLKFEITVLTESNQEKIKNELNILRPLGSSKIINLIKNILIVRKISKNFDVVHSFDGWPYGIYGYFAVSGTRKKFFINGVGTYSVAPLSDKFKGFLLKKAYKKADKIFCISSYVKQRILERVKLNNLKIVHLGSTELPSLSQDEVSFYKEKFNIKDLSRPILLTVGGIKERKGQLDTLKASVYLKEEYSNYLYLIVGSDDDVEYINKIEKFVEENKLENNVKIINNAKTDEELSFFYNICDIFLLNSNNDGDHFEGFGLVFLEAAQFGKPVVGSNNCGIEDAIKEGSNGYLVAQKDAKNVYNAIIKGLNNKEIDFRKNSKEFYKKFSWKSTALEYSRDY